jgi:hypothetical protein
VTLTAGVARAELSPARPQPVEFVTVAANTGAASGGHAALRVGERVYHYQTGHERLLRLERESWPLFQHRYAVFDNRSLRISRLTLDPEAQQRIEARLARLYAVQGRHFDRLDALALELRWLEALGAVRGTLRLRGLGLLAADARGDPDALRLREALEARHGAGFLAREIAAVEAALREHALEVSHLGSAHPKPGRYPEGTTIGAERLRDRLLLREALQALDQGRPVATGALLDPAAAGAGLSLADAEREGLERFVATLEASALRLVRSRRPDRGFPLILLLARYQAARRSLDAGRLLVLDPVPDDAEVIPLETIRRYAPGLEPLATHARRDYLDLRTRLLSSPTLDERGYNHLETATSRYVTLQAAARGSGAVRVWADGPLVPSRSGLLVVPPIQVDLALREQALATARSNQTRYRTALREAYGYRLLRHNCATELVRALRSAFPGEHEPEDALGGNLRPGEGLGFIPGALGRQVARRWAVAETREVPSHRKRRVSDLARQGRPAWVHLRESNTWTATAYEASTHDDAFLWFTDGPIPARPAQGAFNLGYGLLHAIVGVVALPVDGGRRALAGLRGAFYSLPELAGFNIRKGRYEVLPVAESALADAPGSPRPDGRAVASE